MAQYLVAIHHPDDYDPAVAEDDAMRRDIAALNDEMKAAGVRIFVGGLQPASSAKTLRVEAGGKTVIIDGPCRSRRGDGVGTQGCDCLPSAGRSAAIPLALTADATWRRS